MYPFFIAFIILLLTDQAYGSVVPKINLGQQEGHFQGDIVKDERPSVDGTSYLNRPQYRTFQTQNIRSGAVSNLWNQGIIYYELGSDMPWSQQKLNLLSNAMTEIQDNTCIKFVKRVNQINYIRIVNGTGTCASSVGQRGGVQEVNLFDSPSGSCWFHETVVHELLHAVGLLHEQMRPDRDDYLYIFNENIDPAKMLNFVPCHPPNCSTYGIPYNYFSVMHYDITAFSNSKKVTMLPKDTVFANALGRAKTGHPFDYELVRRMYKCPNSTVTCYQCESSSSNGNCKSGSCQGDVCYTSVWPDRIVKGCGNAMYTLVGCRDGGEVCGRNTICGCKTNLCNSEISAENSQLPRCKASAVQGRLGTVVGVVMVLLCGKRVLL